MARKQPLNRWKGLVVGVVGGVAGVLALKFYWRRIEPELLPPDFNPPLPDEVKNLPDIEPAFGRLYRDGESPTAAAGRALYTQLVGAEPDERTSRWLDDAALLAWGIAAGATYGATRNTTRWRDVAGGVFYGLRLWAGDTVSTALLGLRADPKAVSAREHLSWLIGHWVYSFVMTNLARVLYRLL